MSKVFSTEDKNLQSSVRVVRKKLYSDIDLTLSTKSSGQVGDVYKKTDASAVKQAIKTLVMTNRFEKPYRPSYGGNLGGMLFELATEDTGEEIIERVTQSIERYEPRAKILNIDVFSNPDQNSISVLLEFRVINTNAVETLNLNIRPSAPRTAEVLPTTAPPVPVDVLLSDEAADFIVSEQGEYIAYD
jgi:phage baseplate assembly protein W